MPQNATVRSHIRSQWSSARIHAANNAIRAAISDVTQPIVHLSFMETYSSGTSTIRIYGHEPTRGGPHPALILLHGSGGMVSYWADRFAPTLEKFGIAVYAPH